MPAGCDRLQGEKRCFGLEITEEGIYEMELEATSDLSELAQLPVSMYWNNLYRFTLTYQGMKGKTTVKKESLGELKGKNHYVKLVLHMDGLDITRMIIAKR